MGWHCPPAALRARKARKPARHAGCCPRAHRRGESVVSPAINSCAGCASSICFSEISEPWPRFHGNAERADEGSLQSGAAGALSLPSPAAVLALHTRSCSCATAGAMWELPGVCAAQVCAHQVGFVPVAPGERTEAAPGWEGSKLSRLPMPSIPARHSPRVAPHLGPVPLNLRTPIPGTRGSGAPKWPRQDKKSPGCPVLRESPECRSCQLLTQHQPPRDLPRGLTAHGNTWPWNLFSLCGLKLFPCLPKAIPPHPAIPRPSANQGLSRVRQYREHWF